MSFLFFAEKKDRFADQLLAALQGLAHPASCLLLEDLPAWQRYFQQPHASLRVIILKPATAVSLAQIVAQAGVLQGRCLVIIPPDSEESTLALSHQLRPRYIGDADADPAQTIAVLLRLKEKISSYPG